ncbi:phosphohydrolase [Patescibacteria group bacterium]|nr:phosphohydrolase [Patescibacteria group bacterium]
MITREEALSLVQEKVENKNIIKHMIATEALMAGVYDDLEKRGRSKEELGGSREEWMMAGLLHDGDYTPEVSPGEQGIKITEWAREKGYGVPENVAHAMAAHNWTGTGVEPKNLMDWAIFLGDSLTGLIVATTLVLPDKKISAVTPEMVLRRFNEKAFAKGTRREDIKKCEEKLGLSLEEFVRITLQSMQDIALDLGF